MKPGRSLAHALTWAVGTAASRAILFVPVLVPINLAIRRLGPGVPQPQPSFATGRDG